jgi:hypothetical protein
MLTAASALLEHNVIRQAFENTINVLGERTKQTLIEDLTKSGVFLQDPEITLSKLVNGIKEILGDEAAELVAERLIIKLDKMHSMHKQEL